uniref:TNFR-Cys domain-containing protein n=1 Tax=Denticeps clupeoides TaxID=299321 RepID=A0AAY4BCI7_9TELE
MECSESQFYFDGTCHACPRCPPGQELSQDCGYGSGSAASCVPCSARWFKEDWGSHGCRLCRVCRRVNRREVSACTPSRDALCGECLPGFYSKRRLDGGEDVECMTCGPSTFSELQCSRKCLVPPMTCEHLSPIKACTDTPFEGMLWCHLTNWLAALCVWLSTMFHHLACCRW